MSGCTVVSDKRRSSLLQHQGGYVLLTANKSPEYNEIPPDKMWGKLYSTTWTSVVRGMQGRSEPLNEF
jgi:hypothetical protein